MDVSQAPDLTVVQPGEGRLWDLGTIGAVLKLEGERTNGQVSLVEHPFPVGACVPPHRHTREDEYSIVTEGAIGFRSGDREVVLEAGGYITKPRGETHTMWNAGRVPARMIEVISPAGFEHFFEIFGEAVASGPPDPATVLELADRFGVVLERPEWLADVVERYHLTPPPGG
jgi:mannose-6-phosphate isomerase-like protein (cupin superfamily)